MNKINSTNGVGGLNFAKRAGSTGEIAKESVKVAGKGALGNDAFVSGAAAQAPAGSAATAETAALDRLASAYDANPLTFAKNLAEAALNDVAASLN